MKHILVVGGAGFIGTNLCIKLLQEGNRVCCLDNFYTGRPENLKLLQDFHNFSFVEHDIVYPYKGDKVDEIYNLACPASPVHYQRSPIRTTMTSVLGTYHILEFATSVKAKMLQASTSEIYGDPLIHPQIESYWGNVNPVGIRSCYDEGKRCAESLCMDYNRSYGTEVKIIRIFNTYGPYMCEDDGRVISNFIIQALNNENVTIYGDGSQTRSFQYISDLIQGMTAVMDTGHSFTGPVNIGNPEELSIREIANLVIRLTGSSSKIIYKALPEDDPLKRKPEISLAQKVLEGWRPVVDIESGLKKTINYFKSIKYDYCYYSVQ